MAKTKSLLDEFEFTAELPKELKPTAGGDPKANRRRKMLEAIEQQRRIYKDPNILENWQGKRRPIAWIRRLGTEVYITPRYGMRPLELKPGMPVVKTHMEHVDRFLDGLRDLIESGQLDEKLARLAERMSSDFHKAA